MRLACLLLRASLPAFAAAAQVRDSHVADAGSQRNETSPTPSPEEQPEAVVQRQLEAYNAHDIDAFLATYSPDIELFTLGGDRRSQGLDAMRARYGKVFKAAPELHCDITHRIAQGKIVIDHEHLTGLPNGGSVDAIAIYEVRDGKIRRVWFPQ